jgi:hypothetical protein
MRIHTRLEFQITTEGLELVREEGFDYCGPLARCDRGQSKQVAQQGMSQSSEDQANAGAALQKTNADLTSYNQRLSDFMRFGRQTYGANGEYMRDQNTLATTTAAAGAKGLEGDLALNAMRTGGNTAGYAATDAESRRQSSRDLTSQLAQADTNRLQQLTSINQYGVQASALPAEVQAQLYGTSTGGAANELNPAANAAKTPSGWDVFGQDLAQGVGSAVGAYTGAKACWIAEVLYGVDDLRTHLLRAWLNEEYAKTFVGGLVMKLYRRFGQRIARKLRRHTWLQRFFRPLFDHWLRRAQAADPLREVMV